MKRFITLISLLLCTISLFAQQLTESEYAEYNKAVEYSDNNRIDEAIAIYDNLLKKYPMIYALQYEKAYCLYKKEEWKECIKIGEALESHPDADAEIYQLTGNALDLMGKRNLAHKKYEEGLEKFPDSGALYMEMGTLYALDEDYNEAVSLYEKGIEVDPKFPSNYFRAASLLCYSNYPLYGIIYAEIHNLLEPNHDRSLQLSEAIYDAYNDNISDLRTIIPSLPEALSTDGNLTASDLAEIRRIVTMNRSEVTKFGYPDTSLFNYHQEIIDAGFWREYNLWLFRGAAIEELQKFYEEEQSRFEAFVEWFNQNPYADKYLK